MKTGVDWKINTTLDFISDKKIPEHMIWYILYAHRYPGD